MTDGSQSCRWPQLGEKWVGLDLQKLAAFFPSLKLTLSSLAPNKSGGVGPGKLLSFWKDLFVEPVESDDILHFGESSKLHESMG